MRATPFIASCVAVVAGCYDAPRVELHATKTAGSTGIRVQICDPENPGVCTPGNPEIALEHRTSEVLWLSADASFARFIVRIDELTSFTSFCFVVDNGAGELHRAVAVSGADVVWSCPGGDACETQYDNPQHGENCIAPPPSQ